MFQQLIRENSKFETVSNEMPDNLTFRYLQDICCFCAHSIGINFRSLFVFLSKNFYKKDYDMSEEVKQMQDDEREALISIYEGDEAFKQINPTTFQYKVSSITSSRPTSECFFVEY